jgi:HSP20 family molecular chaperone IbpA
MAKKPSFFQRITGTADEYEDYAPEPSTRVPLQGRGEERHAHIITPTKGNTWENQIQQEEPTGELAVDVYQTPDAIVIKAFIAGVQPNSVDISLTREMVTISGSRSDEKEVDEEHYFQRELYWGSFSRTILLPEEVDVDLAEASERHGILMIRLPKINKKREMKLKVRAR